MKILREHWERTKLDNQNLILNNKIQIEMAMEVIKLCDRKIAAFPVVKPKGPKVPSNENRS